jgi:hypothetical protein
MPIAPVTTPNAEAITTVTTPATGPLGGHEHVAGVARGRGRRGLQTDWPVRWLSTDLSACQKFVPLVVVVAVALALSAPVHADVDTDFANQLHVYGIYGPRDDNAWLAKITCNRLGNGIDADAYESAAFLSNNLPKDRTTAQTWQFLDAAVTTYCPDQMAVLTSAAGPRQ